MRANHHLVATDEKHPSPRPYDPRTMPRSGRGSLNVHWVGSIQHKHPLFTPRRACPRSQLPFVPRGILLRE